MSFKYNFITYLVRNQIGRNRVICQDRLLIRRIVACSRSTFAYVVVVADIRGRSFDLMNVRRYSLLGKATGVIGLVVVWLAFCHNLRFEFILDILAFNFRFLILNLVVWLHWGAMMVSRRNRFYALHKASLEVTFVLLLVLRLLEL